MSQDAPRLEVLPVARALFELPQVMSDGKAHIAGRELWLREGRLVSVEPGPEDGSLIELARDAGHLKGEPPEGSNAGERLAKAGLSERTLTRLRRAAWIDRLAAALGGEEAELRTAPEPMTDVPRAEPLELTPLLLDALARRAGEREAGIVGSMAAKRLRFSARSPRVDTALRWAGLEEKDEERRIGQVLARSPGAASRLAALFRVGVLTLPQPAAPAEPKGPAEEPVAEPDPKPSLAPPRDPQRNLAPGGTVPPPEAERVELPELPAPELRLDDPLAEVEKRIGELERAGAPGPERAAAWLEAARIWQRDHGAVEEAARALREAVAAHPDDPKAARQAARACLALGQMAYARAYARTATVASGREPSAIRLEARLALLDGDGALAETLLRELEGDADALVRRIALTDDDEEKLELAKALRAHRPEAARTVLAELAAAYPDEPGVCAAHADALAADGYAEAAGELLLAFATELDDPDGRRTIRWHAAELAEEHEDLAAAFDALWAAHVDEPHVDLLHEPLALYAEAIEPARQAVVLEHLGRIADVDRHRWFLRASEAFDDLAGSRFDTFQCALQAALSGGGSESLEALARAGERDEARLADAFERVGREADPPLRDEAWAALAVLADKELDAPQRALHAWKTWVALGNEPDPTVRAAIDDLEPRAEREAQRAQRAREGGTEGPDGQRRLAVFLRNDPDTRDEAIALYREVVTADPHDSAAAAALESLLRSQGDADGWRAHLEQRLAAVSGEDSASGRVERRRLLAELRDEAAARRDWKRAAELTARGLGESPSSETGVARLELFAALAGDDALQARATEARLALRPHERQAAAFVARAGAQETSEQAVVLLRRALAVDARCAAAHRALVDDHLHALPPDEALEALERARDVLGDDPRRSRRVIELLDDADGAANEWARLTRLAPHDRTAARDRLEDMTRRGHRDGIRAAAEGLLRHDDRRSGQHLVEAAEALTAAGHPMDAVDVLLRASDALGAPELLLHAEELSASASSRVAVLERLMTVEAQRSRAIRELARLYRQLERPGTESRALLRLLAEEDPHPMVLARLEELFARYGDEERLAAVLELRLERAERPDERRQALKRMASAAFLRRMDADATAQHLQALAREGDEGAREAAAVWTSLGEPRRAIELLKEHAETLESRDDAAAFLELAVQLLEHEVGDGEAALELAAEALASGRRTPGLLLTFERLALAAGANDLAKETYDAMRARTMGRHGERGTLYREARWLERADDIPAALEIYGQAFALAPTDGAVLRALERLASRETVDGAEHLVRALTLLADHQTQPDRRLEYEARAVQLMEEKLDDVPAAFERLTVAWRATQRSALVPELRRLLTQMRERGIGDPAAGIEALREGLRARVEMTWDVPDQVNALLTLSEVESEDAADPKAAAAILTEEVFPRRAKEGDEVDAEPIAARAAALAEQLRAAGEASLAEELSAKAATLAAEAAVEAEARANEQAFDFEMDDDTDATPASGEEPPEPSARADVARPPESASDIDARPSEASSESDSAGSSRPSEPASAPESDSAVASPPSSVPGSADVGPPKPSTTAEADSTAGAEPAPPPEPAAKRAEAAGVPTEDARAGRTDDRPEASARATHEYIGRVPVQPSEEEASERPTSKLLERWHVVPAPSEVPDERELRERMAAGDRDAMASLGEALAAVPERAREAQEVLLRLLRTDPSRVDSIRLLAKLAEQTGALGLARACSEVRALYGEVAAPERPGGYMRRLPSFLELVPSRPEPMLDVLGLVWREAQSLFRKRLEDYGVLGTRRVTAHTRAVGPAYARAAERLDMLDDASVYLHEATVDLEVIPAHVPAVLVGRAALESPVQSLFRFRLGHALELCRAEQLLVATRDAEAREALALGVWSAFGPAAAQGDISKEAASFAADLWRTIPTGAQGKIRRLCPPTQPEPEALVEETRKRAARAGYLVDGSLAVARDALALEYEVLRDSSEPAGYERACRECPPFASVVALCFEDACLTARSAEEP